MDLSPALVLGMWSAGIAGGGAVVALWRVVGPGYTWLTAAVAVLFGAGAAAAGGGGIAWAGVVLAVAAALLARVSTGAAIAFGAATAAFAAGAAADAPALSVLTGALLLGGVTSEMMLGHWYLVDPRLPRWALRRLAVAGIVGLGLDFVYLAAEGLFDWGEAGVAMGWAYLALAVMTGLLAVAVWFALGEPRYTAVMAATGLSYLATLTAIGVVVVGRMVAFPS